MGCEDFSICNLMWETKSEKNMPGLNGLGGLFHLCEGSCLCATSPTGKTNRVLYCYGEVWFFIFLFFISDFDFYSDFVFAPHHPLERLTGSSTAMERFDFLIFDFWFRFWFLIFDFDFVFAPHHPLERLIGSSTAMGRCHLHHSKLVSTSIVHNIWC